MSDYKMHSITYVQPRVYDVVFTRDGEAKTVRCSVIEHAGITVVQPAPDIFMSGEAGPPREIFAAVLAFDRARAAG